ncbi:MAG: zinc-binding dehydrogenase [SAR202 cluster bacterium]|nr:zinc-binding dehydrogenase [SAR202 cluster bacterium]
MKGVVFLGDRKAEVRQFPEEEPGPAEVLLRMRASGMCGSDLHKYRAPVPEITFAENRIGHEPCGEVAAVGAGVTNLRVGDRVINHHYLGCGQCRFCHMGYQQLCNSTAFKKGYYGGSLHGGHGDYMVCAASTCVPLPDELTFEAGAMLACGTSTAYLALTKLEVSGRDVLAIFGQGPVGVAATMLGAAMGARVIAVDPSPARLELARKAGAWKTVNPGEGDSVGQIMALTHGEGADATLEAVGLPLTRKQAATSARVFGRSVLVGERGQAIYDATPDIIHRHLTIYGSWTVSMPGMEEAARFVVDRQIPLHELISDRVAIGDAVDAYRRFDRQDTGKMVIVWD